MALEPPYGVIYRELKKSRVVPFLGAGASFSSRPDNAAWDDEASAFLPSGRELALALADEVTYPSDEPHDRGNLAKVASYYMEAVDRQALLARLREVFDREYQVGQIHHFLADFEAPLLITTTNYDTLIEQAFLEKSRPYHLVLHPTDHTDLSGSVLWWKPGDTQPSRYPPSQLPLSLKDTTIIYKIHGSVDRETKKWDSFVITEEDYVDFLARMTGRAAIPARFMLHYRQSRFLFLGYGLHDWNLRVMLKNLRTTLTRRGVQAEAAEVDDSQAMPEGAGLRSWAIQYQPTELERVLWNARQVNIYDIPIDEFAEKLSAHAG